MAGTTLTTRLPEWLEEEIREEFEQRGEGPSEGLRRVVQEWWILTRLTLIEIREGVTGPRPALKGGPEVWEVILVRRWYENDPKGLRDYFGGLTEEQLRQALACYELFPEPVDEHLREIDRLNELHEAGLL
ncbi:MAG: hypothetical protein R6W82_01290 [bacterium]